MKEKSSVDYGNWMPSKFLFIGSFVSIALVGAAILIPFYVLKIIIGIIACLVLYMLFIALRARRYFSDKGKDFQKKINNLVIDHCNWDGSGTCLDIGCGQGPLSIALARKHSSAKVIALDYWGKTGFEYSENQCRINAEIEGVVNRMEFVNASAGSLPFEDESMDAVVSNLTFHEVKDFKMKEKHKSILEALRVLKKGGIFSFQDLFGAKSIYGDFNTLKHLLEKQVSEIHFYDTFNEEKLPRWLNTPFMFEGIGIFYGIK